MLGLGKRHLALLCAIETVMTAVIALVVGTGIGVGLSFAVELGLRSSVEAEVAFAFAVKPAIVAQTVVIYLAIFLLILLSSVVKVGRSTAVSLLRSRDTAKSPPRAICLWPYWARCCWRWPILWRYPFRSR